MDTVKLWIGSTESGNSGRTNDSRRPVEFVGEELACHIDYGHGNHGGITDTRGVTETLYRSEDGRLLVYVEDWSRWRGEPSHYSLQEVTAADLDVGGGFEHLGREAGFARSLRLDEALRPLEDWDL